MSLIPTSHHIRAAERRAAERRQKEREAKLLKDRCERIVKEFEKRGVEAQFSAGEFNTVTLEGVSVPVPDVLGEMRELGILVD